MSTNNARVSLATLRDVAEAAGVSVSTASRALSGKGQAYRISLRTIEMVRQQADRLDFQPSALARSLRSQRSGLLGVVVPDIANPFFAAITKEVTLLAETRGLSVLVADSRESTEVEMQLLKQLQARRVEGLVVCPVGLRKDHLEELHAGGVPLVIVDRCFADSRLVSVLSDNLGGAAEGVEHLLKLGHRAIGCIQGLPGTLPNEARLTGIMQRLKRAGVTLDSSHIAGDNFTEPSGYQAALRLLKRHPDLTALFTLCVPSAFGALRAAEKLRRRVPEDLSILTFDDSPMLDLLRVPLSTISQDVKQLGQVAAELVVSQLQSGQKPKVNQHVLPVRMILRQSTTRKVE